MSQGAQPMANAGSDSPRGDLTYADYAALPDDGTRYQLVEGELVVTPSPTSRHQVVSAALQFALECHVREHALGCVLFAPLDVILDEHTVLQPDLLFISNERMGILKRANVRGAPDLAVEILSPATQRLDRVQKLDVYARRGVAHYWIVDLDARSIEEYVAAGDVFRLQSVTAGDDEFRPALFPAFAFHLASVRLPEDAE